MSEELEELIKVQNKLGGAEMVHWIWLVVAFITGGSTGFVILGLLAANQEQHRKWWDDG